MKRCVLALLIACFTFSASVARADTKVYFSPNGGCQDAIIAEIARAQKTIDIAMYAFTSREIAQEVVRARDRGVKVRIVLDKEQAAQKYSKSRYLAQKGPDVRYHTGPGIMHNKVGVIDGNILITGSFNWTPTADRKNEENLLIITDKDLINKYQERFEDLWKFSN